MLSDSRSQSDVNLPPSAVEVFIVNSKNCINKSKNTCDFLITLCVFLHEKATAYVMFCRYGIEYIYVKVSSLHCHCGVDYINSALHRSIDNVPQKQTQKTGRMKAVENAAARCWAIVRVVLRNTVSTYLSRPG